MAAGAPSCINASMQATHDADRRRRRITEIVTEKGWTVKEWCVRAGVSPNTLYNFLNGRSQSISLPILEKLANASKTPISRLTGEAVSANFVSAPLIEIRGSVEAGVWKEAAEWPEDERRTVAVPVAQKYADKAFGLVVNGGSMNEIYPPGSIITCISLENYTAELESGDRVVVERRSTDGLHETTCKELKFDDDGRPWLWPRSNSPKHQQPIELPWPPPIEYDDDTEIRLVAVVLGSYRPEKQ